MTHHNIKIKVLKISPWSLLCASINGKQRNFWSCSTDDSCTREKSRDIAMIK